MRRPWVFFVILTSQTASLLGSQLAGFGISVWLYEQTRSTTLFGLVSAVVVIPRLLAQPLVGAVLDRWDRRQTIILGDLGAAVCTVVLLLAVQGGQLVVWRLVILVGLASALGAASRSGGPVLDAAIVAPERLGNANGWRQLGLAIAQLGAPALASVLLGSIGLVGLIAIDVASFCLAIVTLAVVPLPANPHRRRLAWRSVCADWGHGARYVWARSELLAFVLVIAAVNFVFGMVGLFLTPLVLSFAGTVALGGVLAAAGVGAVVGSLGLAAWGEPRRPVTRILTLVLLGGAFVFVGTLVPSVGVVAVGAFGFMFVMPIVMGIRTTLLQRRVPRAVHGRVLAFDSMATGMAIPLAYLVGGPLIEEVFEPLLQPGGLLADSLGALLGVGEGRGTALFGWVLVLFLCVCVAIAYRTPALRRLDAAVDVPGDGHGGR